MPWRRHRGGWREVPPAVYNEIYDSLLKQMHVLAEESLNRLTQLHDRFPADLSEDLIDRLRKCHQESSSPAIDPTREGPR
jgi:hypothetical protein